MGLAPEIRRVAPRAIFTLTMPWGPIDLAEAPGRPGSPIAPPFPDLLIASGRRAIPYVRTVKRASGGRTFTVILKDPRRGSGAADLIWVPEHDRLRGENVLATLTGPHRISAGRLAAARASPDPRLAGFAVPRVAVLAGGDSRHHRFTADDAERLASGLEQIAASGASLMVTASRRTPAPLAARLREIARQGRGFFWDGTGENPYLAMLALADYIVVTADSANMIGEAAATGRPVLVFEPSGGHIKLSEFMAALTNRGIVRPFSGVLEGSTYEPLDTTPAIAGAIAAALARHRGSFEARRAG
jgi:mitochondrial fission protein ELM1